jgi:FkbM family methyltransferase
MRPNTSDVRTFCQLYINKEYDFEFARPQVIVDAGANIGFFTLQMKSQFPETKIICIEPDADNFNILKKNTSYYENIFCENCGLWNKNTKLKVYDKYNLGKWGMVVEEDSKNGTIPAISINTIFEKYSLKSIDLLKLDIETSEKQVFLDNYAGWLPKVKTIVIELHDRMEAGSSRPFFEAINKTFSKYNYFVKGENTIIENKDLG